MMAGGKPGSRGKQAEGEQLTSRKVGEVRGYTGEASPIIRESN
jgi:hypothetical protein